MFVNSAGWKKNNVQQICRTCRRLQTHTQALWQAGIFAKILMLAWVHQYANENKNGRLIACPPWKAGFDFDLDNSQWRAQSIIQDCSEDGNVMHGGHCFSLKQKLFQLLFSLANSLMDLLHSAQKRVIRIQSECECCGPPKTCTQLKPWQDR